MPVSSLLELKQTGTVVEYTAAFWERLHRVLDLDPNLHIKNFVHQYIEGLREDIQDAVWSRSPSSITGASSLARIREDEIVQEAAMAAEKLDNGRGVHVLMPKVIITDVIAIDSNSLAAPTPITCSTECLSCDATVDICPEPAASAVCEETLDIEAISIAAPTPAACSTGGLTDVDVNSYVAVPLIVWSVTPFSTAPSEATPTSAQSTFSIPKLDSMAPTRCWSLCFDRIGVLTPMYMMDENVTIKQPGQMLRPMPWPSFKYHSEATSPQDPRPATQGIFGKLSTCQPHEDLNCCADSLVLRGTSSPEVAFSTANMVLLPRDTTWLQYWPPPPYGTEYGGTFKYNTTGMLWFPILVNQVHLLWKSPWPPPEQEQTSGVAEMFGTLMLRAQANTTTREGIPLQLFARKILSRGQGATQFNKIEALADLGLNHGMKDCPLLGTLHFIPLAGYACDDPEVNHASKYFVELGFHHLHEQYKGNYNMIQGPAVIYSFGALTCWYTRVYFSVRQWDPGIVQFIFGTSISVIGNKLHISIKFTAVYCELDCVQPASSSTTECSGDGSVGRFYLQFLSSSMRENTPSWRRNGFSPGHCVQPHLGRVHSGKPEGFSSGHGVRMCASLQVCQVGDYKDDHYEQTTKIWELPFEDLYFCQFYKQSIDKLLQAKFLAGGNVILVHVDSSGLIVICSYKQAQLPYDPGLLALRLDAIADIPDSTLFIVGLRASRISRDGECHTPTMGSAMVDNEVQDELDGSQTEEE